MSSTVFITRHEEEITSLILLVESSGIAVTARSLIKTSPVHFKQPIPKSDWIFFSSSNGVRHFFNQLKEIPKTKFAAIGTGTADELNKFVKPDFIGNSIDIMATARQFATLAGNSRILFPGAEKSLQNVQSVFDKKQIKSLVCYRTENAPSGIGYPDVLIFSSPSNVQSFFLMNKLLSFQQAIAYGESTAKELRKYGVENISIPRSLSDKDLLEAINEVVVS